MSDFWIYLLILAGSTYLIRAVPFALLQKKITNRFVQSFLYYSPFSVLASMTFPAAFHATGSVLAAVIGLCVGGIFAVKGKGMTLVAAVCCVTALAAELLLTYVI